MERNPKLSKASRALFVVSLVLGIVILILSALAIALAMFGSNNRREEKKPLELQPIDDTAQTYDNRLRLIETNDSSRLSRKERISRGG
jgi:hypothetical protein